MCEVFVKLLRALVYKRARQVAKKDARTALTLPPELQDLLGKVTRLPPIGPTDQRPAKASKSTIRKRPAAATLGSSSSVDEESHATPSDEVDEGGATASDGWASTTSGGHRATR